MNNTIIKIALILLSFITMISLYSCNKNKTTSDTTKPIITMVEPTDMDTITLSIDPEVHIEFTASDNEALHSLDVKLLDSANQLLQQSTPNVMDQTSYAFHTHYIPSGVTGLTWVKVQITTTDHSENTTTKELKVFLKP